MSRHALRIPAIALVVMTASLAAQTEPIYLAAGDLQLAFSGRTGVLVSARDSKTGADLSGSGDDDHGGGWRFLLQMPDGRKASAELGDAAAFESHRTRLNGREALSLEWHGLKLSDGSTIPDASVTAAVAASPEDSSATWQISIHGLGIWRVILVDCIDIRNVGSLGGDQSDKPPRLFFPEGAGKVYRDPAHSLPNGSWLYPTQASMQFMAIYGASAGFSITGQDTTGELKAGTWKSDKAAGHLTFTHIFRELRSSDATVPYPVQLSLFHGDWQTAAAQYRSFVDSAPWTRDTARPSIILEETFQTMTLPPGMSLGQKEALSELEHRAQSQANAWGEPMVVSLGDFAQLLPRLDGRDTTPQIGWASLDASIRQLNRSGNFAAADLSAYCGDTTRPCPGTQTENLTAVLYSHGINIFTLDLWPEAHPAFDSQALRRNDFFHPVEGRDFLSRLAGNGRVVGAKQPAELLLPKLQFFRTRSCNVPVDEVPAFDFVYHAFTSMECETQRTPEQLLTIAKAFTAGQRVLTSYKTDADSEDFQLFLKNTTVARRGFARPFLAQGTMLPDAAIETPVDSAVRSGVWRAKNGDVGIALANTSRDPAPVRVAIDFERWGLSSGRDYTLRTVNGSGAVLLADGVHGSTGVSVVVGALDVLLISIHENLVGGGAIERIVNAAKGDEPCGIAPGEVIDITGEFRGTDRVSAADLSHAGPYALELDQTSVLFDGIRAAILMASPNLVRAIVPWTVAGRPSVNVQVTRHGITTEFFSARVQAACPGIYSSATADYALVKNADGSLNSPEQPAARGSRIVIYATGLGVSNSRPRPGEEFGGTGAVVRPIRVTIGGVSVRAYAAFSPKIFSGVYEIQAGVPDSIPPGKATLLVGTVADGSTAQQSIELHIAVQ